MKMIYVTLNNADEARAIARTLLERQAAVCCNWFPITCAYRWEGKIMEEPETVLLVKTRAEFTETVEEIVKSAVSYTNCIARISPDAVNGAFLDWLNREVPGGPAC